MKIIGIDPDMRNPGTCELHDGVIFDIGSMTTAYLLASIPWYIANDYVFAVENVNEVKGIYTRNQDRRGCTSETPVTDQNRMPSSA